ncbi:hypothetical protein B0J17DRAFT_151425 [Rhizoctonia solani]|nr:hypothetical protein B0J17DRAFT_151425 [Rhizoctonia solani]
MSYFPMYETKIKEAEMEMTLTYCMIHFSLADGLPAELMIHIFHLVLASEPCDLGLLSKAGKCLAMQTPTSNDFSSVESFTIYPDHLAQVCSRWRQIPLSSPSLWSYIDLIPHQKIHKGTLARARLHTKRASPIPIVLHIHGDKGTYYNKQDLEYFLVTIARRTKSLDLGAIGSGTEFTQLVLITLLRESSSGPAELSQLTASCFEKDHLYHPHFMSINQGWSNPGALRLALPQSVIDDSLAELSILHLRGLFRHWLSGAYDNLVDLRLIAASESFWPAIHESDFQDILEASPRLRILHFAFDIISTQARDSHITPVSLEDLEVVNIVTPFPTDRAFPATSEPGDVLRIIAPGLKPLQLSIWHYSYRQRESSTKELKNFFQRSKITKFFGKGTYPPLDELLPYVSNLQVLALDPHEFEFCPEKTLTVGRLAPAVSTLNHLILVDWDYHKFDELDLFLQYHPAKTVVLISYTVSSQSDQAEIWKLKRHPDIRVFSHHPGNRTSGSLDNWDILSIHFGTILHL